MNDLISIIVPIHNCEETIDRCLSSLTSQSYKNLEIILVENGSSDQSLSICQQWSNRDPRIRILVSPLGVSNARNEGLEHINGDFFAFVDADDYVDCSIYEKLYNKISQENADMAFCRINNFFDDGHIQKSEEKNLSALLFEKKVFYWYSDGAESVRRVVWRTLFRRSVYDTIRFNTQIFFGEDRDYLQLCYLKSSKCTLVDEYLYYYYCNYFIPNYTAKKYYKERKIFSSRSSLTQNSEKFLNYFGYLDLAKEQRFKALIMCIEDSIFVEDKEFLKAVRELYSDFYWKETNSKQYYRSYLKFHKSINERIKAFLVKFNLLKVFYILKHIKK